MGRFITYPVHFLRQVICSFRHFQISNYQISADSNIFQADTNNEGFSVREKRIITKLMIISQGPETINTFLGNIYNSSSKQSTAHRNR